MNVNLEKFLSRKFLAALAGVAVVVLSATGVIDPARETEVAAAISAGLYIVVEGMIDLLRKE